MREKIAEIIKGYDDDWEDPCYRSADAILTLLCEEIGKVGNPIKHRVAYSGYREGYECCRKDILALLQKEGER